MILYDAERANQRLVKQDALIKAMRGFYDAYWDKHTLKAHVLAVEAAQKDLDAFDVEHGGKNAL